MYLRLRFLLRSIFTWSVNYIKNNLGEKGRHTFLCNIRIVIRKNQPRMGRKKKECLSLDLKNTALMKKTAWLLSEMRDYLRCTIFWTLAILYVAVLQNALYVAYPDPTRRIRKICLDVMKSASPFTNATVSLWITRVETKHIGIEVKKEIRIKKTSKSETLLVSLDLLSDNALLRVRIATDRDKCRPINHVRQIPYYLQIRSSFASNRTKMVLVESWAVHHAIVASRHFISLT